MIFHGYTPYTPTKPDPPRDDVSLVTFRAAQRAGATHLSANGRRIFVRRYGGVYEAEWDADAGDFGSWWVCDELPADAVELP